MRGGTYVLNFYSAVFVDQLKRGRKTATIRLGDKSGKYERGQVVWGTAGFRHRPHNEPDNPEFRRLEDERKFLEQIYSRPILEDDTVTVIRFSQITESPKP